MATKSKKQDKSNSVRDQLADLSNNSLIAGMMIVGTLVVAGSIVASKVLISEIGFNNRVLSEKRAVNATLEQNVNNLESLKTNFESMQSEGVNPSDVLTALPIEHDFHNLSGQLELLSSLSGAQLLTVTLSGDSAALAEPTAEEAAADGTATAGSADTATTTTENTGSSGVQPATFTVSANGTYSSLQTFISATEIFIRPIQINTVKFSGSEPSVVLEMTLTTYYQPRTEVSNETRTIQ